MRNIKFPICDENYIEDTYSKELWGDLAVECPHCEYDVEPKVVVGCAYFHPESETGEAFAFAMCPRCEEKIFIKYTLAVEPYQYGEFGMNGETHYLAIRKPQTYPAGSVYYDPESIEQISPAFIKIYRQALQAENMGLDEVCGAGYRRAVEFLIRDYLIETLPDEAEKIPSWPFADCINKLDDDTKTLTQGISWLSTDFVHYSKNYEDYSLDDLKEFIDLLVLRFQSKIKETLAIKKIANIQEKRKANGTKK